MPMATLETEHLEVGHEGLLNIFMFATLRNRDNIKVVIEPPPGCTEWKSRSRHLPHSALKKISCGLVHWNSNLVQARYAGNTRVVGQAGLPATADEYMASSNIPMPSYEFPMPFAGPYNGMTGQPKSKAVENALKENLSRIGLYQSDATKEEDISKLLPGAEIPELPAYSTIRKTRSEKGGQSVHPVNSDGKVRMGYPEPQGDWVESELRFDGQDGPQWDQLIKDTGEGKGVEEGKFLGYDAGGKTIEAAQKFGFEDWSPCQAHGLSWWPVMHMQVDLEHNAVRAQGPLLKEVEIYCCWYQIMNYEMWKGPDQFWAEAWTVQGRRFIDEGGRFNPEESRRFLRGIGDVEHLLGASAAASSSFRSAAHNSNE